MTLSLNKVVGYEKIQFADLILLHIMGRTSTLKNGVRR